MVIKKITPFIFLFFSLITFGQNKFEIDASKINIKPFDKISDINLITIDSNKIIFGYSEERQRFNLLFDEELSPNKYYRIDIKGLETKGNSSPIFFAQFYNGKNRIANILFNIHQEFYVIKTPEVFDDFRIVIQYSDVQVEFSSIIFSQYNIKKEQNQFPNRSFISLILPVKDASVVDYIDFSERVLNDSIFKNKYYDFGNYYDQTLWQGNEHSRTEQRWIQGFFWLLNLMNAYEQTKDIAYLKKSSEIIKIWDSYIRTNSSKNNIMIWHDETAAWRLFALLYAYDYLTTLEDTALNELIKGHLTEHAKKLAEENFYTRNNNHGMFQSLSLYAYSYNSWDSLSPVYHDLALARITDYFLFSFTNEGISKENTPYYHYLISKQLGDFIEVFNKLESSEINKKLETIFESSKYYSLNLIKPNGLTPSLGDNTPFDPDSSYSDFLKDINIGKYRESTNICFKETGYAIMRSKWDDPKSFYLFFSAAYNHWSHKHNDDLSFMLTYKGNDILIDCSFFGYEYNKDIVKFGYSSFAHNSLVVDNTSLGILSNQDKKYSEVGISHWHDAENEIYVKGFNSRWNYAEHYRSINWNKKNTVVVTDSIIAKDNKNHNYKLLYHFGKVIVPKIENQKVKLYIDNNIIGTIQFETNEHINLHIFKGNDYPNKKFKGYHCEEMSTFLPVEHFVLVIEFINSKGIIETKFKLK